MIITLVKMFTKLIILLFAFSGVNSNRFPDMWSYYFSNQQYSSLPICDEALGNFSQSSAKFFECAVKFSRPIRMCEHCVNQYTSASKDYTSLLTLKVNDTSCKDLLVNLDRVQIFYTTYDNVKNLWKKANCDRCFTWNDTVATLSPETSHFIDLFDNASECIKSSSIINTNDTEKTCKQCMDQYVELNNFYESLKGWETDNLCMDIVDSMNATRAIWSDVLNCCRLRRTPEVYFLLSTALISLTPPIFYFIAKLYCESSKYRLMGQTRYVTSFRSDPSTSCN